MVQFHDLLGQEKGEDLSARARPDRSAAKDQRENSTNRASALKP